jgi:5-formyltetrahydrofolate cyclo-ligase
VPQNPSNPPNRVALRKLLLAQRYGLGSADRESRQQALIDSLSAYIKQHHPLATVALYAPHAAEANVLGLAELIDNPLCLPVVVQTGQPLQFARWKCGDPLVKDRYGIGVPLTKIGVQPNVLVIPCLGYTRQQLRLGYGGGYYDRTLADLRGKGHTASALGVAWRQALCAFAAHDYDIAMDAMHLA